MVLMHIKKETASDSGMLFQSMTRASLKLGCLRRYLRSVARVLLVPRYRLVDIVSRLTLKNIGVRESLVVERPHELSANGIVEDHNV